MFFVVYEAGKGIKTGSSSPQSPVYPPYFVTGVPTMVPIAPPSLVDKMSSVPPSDGSILTAGEAFRAFLKSFKTSSINFVSIFLGNVPLYSKGLSEFSFSEICNFILREYLSI